MASQKLQCPCGHGWEEPDPGPVPDDLRSICPVCTPGVRSASHPTATGPEARRADPAPHDSVPGFEIIRPLSRGGMGVVYEARQAGLNRLVALKVVAPERLGGSDRAEYLERFRREARAAALLNHPNIVAVYATDLDGPRPYFAMEYVDGIDLYRLVKKAGPLGVLESCDYVRQAAVGLQHAFERGLVHRDVKPHNLMVTPSPLDTDPTGGLPVPAVVKILDLGLARLDAPDPGLAEGLTVADAVLGTPDFVAPEQAEDSRKADVRADLYGLGATWFFLLTGQVPFPGDSFAQKIRRQLTEPTPVVTDFRPDVPPAVAALVRRLMDRDPAERFQTPAELARAIAAFQRDPNWMPDWVLGPLAVPAHPGGVSAIAITADGRRVLTGGYDQRLRVWGAPTLDDSQELSGNPGPVEGVAITGRGSWGASCAFRLTPQDMAVQLWDLRTGAERGRLAGAKDNLVCVALTPDGRRVAAGARDGTVLFWTLDPPGQKPRGLRAHVGGTTGVAFAADGSAILSVGTDGVLRWWEFESGSSQALVRGTAGSLRAVACADGCVALAGDRLALYRPGADVQMLAGHEGGTTCVAFSADGSLLASGGRDGIVRLWRPADGSAVGSFSGHEGPVRAVAVSPDGRVVYSGGTDGTLRRWPLHAVSR